MGTVEEAIAWARVNLSPTQFASFAKQLGLKPSKHFYVSVTFEWDPQIERHLVDPEAIERAVAQHLLAEMSVINVNVEVATRDEY